LKDENQMKKLEENDNGIQFSHSLEEQIGGQLKAGFVLKELYEDYNATGLLKDYAPSFIATRAVKPRYKQRSCDHALYPYPRSHSGRL
jgi:hypothetical protein